MNRHHPILIGILLVCTCCGISSVLITEARADTKSSASSSDIKDVKAKSLGSSTAEKLCAKYDYHCVNYVITISLQKQDGSTYQTQLPPPTPIIQGGNIHIYAGHTFYVEADLSGDALTDLHLVKTIEHPEKTLIMRLTQQTKSPAPDNKSMMFLVYNPFDKNIKYHAVIVPLAEPNSSGTKTSTCPVKAKKTAAEVWQYPLVQIELKGIKLVDNEIKDVCEY